MRECTEHEITVAKLLKIIHRYTERIKIRVVSDQESIRDNVREFYITEDFSGSKDETDRVLKYYADVPVWNLHVEVDAENHRTGVSVVSSIVANCHYTDAREGYLREKADRKKARAREYRLKRKSKDREE